MEKNEKRYAKLICQISPVLVRRYGAGEAAKLIRYHIVAQGAETCDYWYIGDGET